jgi:HPt (histidine-containing phosphotransfer) domain-containing protein
MKISGSDMPVVFISAGPVNEEWQKYRKAGTDAFLQKPFTEEMLLTTIMSVTKDNTQTAIDSSGSDGNSKPVSAGKVNLHNLYHISAGDEQFVKQMIITFINTTQKGLKEMQEDAVSAKWDSVADLAHKLLSPCRHIGAADLYNLLSTVEKRIRNNVSSEPVETLIERSLREFETISELLNEHVAEMK